MAVLAGGREEYRDIEANFNDSKKAAFSFLYLFYASTSNSVVNTGLCLTRNVLPFCSFLIFVSILSIGIFM
jgi:hypothetical protein